MKYMFKYDQYYKTYLLVCYKITAKCDQMLE